jgi:hypothetical protein
MNTFSFDDLNSVWMKPISKYYIKPEEEADIHALSSILLDEITSNIHNVANKIIYKELHKRPKASLHQQLLIKRQVISNVYENITNISINIAKDKYDLNNLLNTKYPNEPELIIVDKDEPELIIKDQTDINCDNYDINLNHSFYSFLEDDDDMQIDYSEYLNGNDETNYLYRPGNGDDDINYQYQPENCDDFLIIE